MEKLRLNLYYVLIGIISLITLGFLPFLGSSLGMAWNIPNSTVGWVVWVGTKLLVAILNILIFHCFMKQGKLNIHDNPDYKKACELLLKTESKEVKPRSPAAWAAKEYGSKGVSIFLSSVMAMVALGQAILSFDWVSFFSYLFTVIMGLIMGVLQMKKAEVYWTEEFLQYATLIYNQRLKEKEENNNDRDKREAISEPGRTGETK